MHREIGRESGRPFDSNSLFVGGGGAVRCEERLIRTICGHWHAAPGLAIISARPCEIM